MSDAGGAPVKLATSDGWVYSIAVSSSCLFWADGLHIVAAAKAGGATGTVAGVEDFDPLVVADDTGAYWADQQAGVIRRLSK